MTTLQIFAIGRVNGNRDIVITPAQAQADGDAWTIGEADFDDRLPCEPLLHYSDLASVEAYILGWRNAQQSAELAKSHVPDWKAFVDHAALLDLDAAASDANVPPVRSNGNSADEAVASMQGEANARWRKAQTTDLIEARLDEEFIRRGGA